MTEKLSKIWENHYPDNPMKMTPALLEYWDRVNALDAPRKEYSFDEARQLMYSGILAACPGFNFTPDVVTILRNMLKWVYELPCDLDTTKGILLIGTPGTGKTTLMECLSNLTTYINRRPFKMCYTKEIAKQVERSKDLEHMVPFHRGSWCLDEMGHETGSTKIWGNTQNLFGDLLEYRYRRRHLITHGTTNIDMDKSDPKNLMTVYGERVYSRLHSIFNIVYLNGKDWRIG